MRKWKLGSRLLKQKRLSDEAGVTLVELLAAISIFGVIILLGGAIHMFGQRQFVSQTESANQTTDLNQVMTVMSKDLRRQKPEDVTVDENVITIKNGSVYEVIDGELTQNEVPIVDSVASFTAEKPSPEGDHIKISIRVESDKPGVSDKQQQTTIYFRGEADEETAQDDLE